MKHFTVRTLPSIFLFITFITTLLSGCASSKVTPAEDVSRTLMVEWKSDWDKKTEARSRVALLPDQSLLLLSEQGKEEFTVEHYSPLLLPGWKTPIEFEDDEQMPMIFSNGRRTLLVTQMELDGDAMSLRLRDVNGKTGEISAARTLLVTSEDFEERFEAVHSPDSSMVMLMGYGEEFDVRTSSGKEVDARAIGTVIIDMDDGSFTTSFDTLVYWDDYDDFRALTGVVRNDGVGALLEVVTNEENDDLFHLLVHTISSGKRTTVDHRIPNRVNAIIAGETSNDLLKPTGIAAAVRQDGSVTVAYNMQKGGHVRVLAAAEIELAAGSARFSTPFVYSEKDVELVTLEEEDELDKEYVVRTIIPHANGNTTYLNDAQKLVDKFVSRTNTSGDSGFETVLENKPILILHVDRSGSLLTTAYFERDETWSPRDFARFEAGHTWSVNGNRLSLIVRERNERGVTLFTMNLEDGTSEARRIVELGIRALLGINYTSWNGTDEATLLIKHGPGGDDWSLMRVTR